VIGCSGAVWFDGDGDGQRSSAKSYAEKAYSGTNGDLSKLIANLQPFDAATASQAGHLYRLGGGSLESDEFTRALNNATPAVRAGFGSYVKAWRDNELAK
jgi:hypothetical protein